MRKGLKKTVDAGEILHQLMVLSCFIPLVEHVETVEELQFGSAATCVL